MRRYHLLLCVRACVSQVDGRPINQNVFSLPGGLQYINHCITLTAHTHIQSEQRCSAGTRAGEVGEPDFHL